MPTHLVDLYDRDILRLTPLFVIIFGLFVFFPWGIPQLQSAWSLSCDHGLDYAS